MELPWLDELREKLINATHFGSVQHWFLDRFEEDAEFRAIGVPVQHPNVEAAMQAVAQTIFKRPVELSNVMLVRIPGHDFIHGNAMTNGCMVSVICFEDIRVGLVTVAGNTPDGQSHFARFGNRPVHEGFKPSAN